MSQSNSSSLPSSKLLSAMALVFILGGLIVWYLLPPSQVKEQQQSTSGGKEVAAFPQASFDRAVEAVAAAEDQAFGHALNLWAELASDFPEEDAFRINQGVTVLKWIDATNASLSSGNIKDPAEIERLEAELENAFASVGEVVDALTGSKQAGSKGALLRASLQEVQSQKLAYPADEELQQEAARLLATQLKDAPDQPLLAGALDRLVGPLAGQAEELTKVLTDSMYACWKREPRNLHLLARSINLLLAAEDQRLAELLDYSLEVTRPNWNEVERSIQQIKPDELIPKAVAAVQDNNWQAREVRFLRSWVNVIVGMRSAYQPDRKRIEPDVMALLDTSFLNRISAELDLPPLPTANPPTFVDQKLPISGKTVLWFDYDVDLDFDFAVLGDSNISLYEYANGEFSKDSASEFDLGFKIRSALIADFFAVDNPDRPMATSVEALVQENLPEPATATSEDQSLTPEQIAIANRHNTLQEIFAWGETGVAFLQLAGTPATLSKIEDQTGLENVRSVRSATVFDIESDGDLDLFLITSSGPQVWQNNGNRTFANVTNYSFFEALDASECQLISCDFDGDLDQDILACYEGQQNIVLFENILHGQLRQRFLSETNWPRFDSLASFAIVEIDRNASWDLVVGSQNSLQTTTTRTVDGQVVPLANTNSTLTADGIAVNDFNNDGWHDVLANQPTGVSLLCGSAQGWQEPISVAGAETFDSRVQVADYNQDGFLDIVTISDGKVHLLTNTPTPQQFLAARVRGINDDNGGGRVNHFGIGTTLEVWSQGRQFRRFVDSPTTHFGLGENKAENLRIIFPNGLTQNAERPAPDSLVQEIQELKGSCPFVYGWNGERFELITDLLWNAPLGLQVARGKVIPDRRWEHLVLPAELVQPRGGCYELRVTEELWEVAYFDLIELSVVDHPDGTQLLSNEKVGPPSIATPQLFISSQTIFPVAARDSWGRDQLDRIISEDKNYVRAFDQLVCQGFAEAHFTELDFGDQLRGAISNQDDLRLVLRGWMHPTDTSLNIALSQNPDLAGPQAPSLWVPDSTGKWICVQPFMGFPGGKPKTIVIDLNDVFRSNDHRVRIASSQQIYWDQAYATINSTEKQYQKRALELTSAELRFRGFSKLMPRTIDEPHWYDYAQVRRQAKWPVLKGPFTRFGSVGNLLREDDDLMVVMTSGDEMILRFEAPADPPREGWRRSFVLHCTGWDKDADLNTIAGQGSLPLPFALQESYPAPYNQQEEQASALQKNADYLTRRSDVSPQTSEPTP